jgi:PAS domain S-box-containing protein
MLTSREYSAMPVTECTGWDVTIEKAPIGVFRTSAKGGFLYANPALAKMFGYDSPAELVEEVKDIAKDLLRKPKQREEVLSLLNEFGQVRDFLYEAQAKDKSLRFVSFSARKVEEADGSYYFEGFMHDVTEKKLAEDRLNKLLTEIQGMAYRCEPQHPWRMNWVSDGCRELTGYRKDDLEKQTPVYGNIIWDTHAGEVANIVQSAIEKNTTFTLIYPIRTSQGEKKWVFERGRAVRDEMNNVIYLEGVIQNYNDDSDWYQRERHEAEIKNELQNQKLRRAMWWTVIAQFIVANLVILGVVIAKAAEKDISDAALAALFAGTVGELAAIVFVIVKYVFPSKSENTEVARADVTPKGERKGEKPNGTEGPYPDAFRSAEEVEEPGPERRVTRKG